MTPDLRL